MPARLPTVPPLQDPSLRQFLEGLRSHVESLGPVQPPQPPTGLQVIPVAGGNHIQFTRSNATNFRVYHSLTPRVADAQMVDIGGSNQWSDVVSKEGVQKWYWVDALTSGQSSPSTQIGPVSGTTLALDAQVTITPPSEPSYQTVYDAQLGRHRPVDFNQDRVVAPLTRGTT